MKEEIVKILLIEDNQDDSDLIQRRLGKSVNVLFDVTRAKTLEEGMAQLASDTPDLILSDLGLPDSHGLDTVTKILCEAPQIPLVVLSGFDDEATAIKAVQAGAQDYLVKGQTEGTQIERSLTYAVERARLQRELEQYTQEITCVQNNLLKILDNNADAIIVVNAEKQVLFANPAAEVMLGSKKQDLLKKPFRFPLKKGKTSEIIIGHGREKTVAEMSVVGVDWEGKPAFLASLRDVTERKQAEEALRESEEKFSKAFRRSPEAIAISGIDDGKFFEVNDSFLRQTGYTPEEAIGKSSSDLNIWSDPEQRAAMVKTLKEKGVVSNEEYNFHTKTGQECIWLFSAEAINIGNQPCILSVATDITERKKTEEALRRSEEKFRELISTSFDGIIATDPEMRVVVWNQGATRILGYTEKEMLGQPIMKVIPEKDRRKTEKLLTALNRRRPGQSPNRTLEGACLRKDGAEVPIELSISSRKSGESHIVTAIIRDITQRREAEEKLRKVDEMKRDFLSNVSHELRTPLQSIGGFTKLIMNGQVPDEATQKEFLEIIDRESQHLGSLIDNLLDMSRLEAGRFEVYKRPTPIRDTFIDAVKSFQSLAREKNITFNEEIPEALPEMEIDAGRLRQVITNLVGNAIKFSEPGGSVTVQAEALKDAVLFQVSDHGIGISPETQKHLFERFYRDEGEVVRGGTGLGLFISKQIIDAHGGRIWAESRPGEGSTFNFTIPLGEKTPVIAKGGNNHGKENTGN